MNQIYVKKYGGTSVATIAHLKRVAREIKSCYENQKEIVVVVSAMGKTTDQLVKMAHKINSKPNGREMDMLLSTGEQVSISLLAMALHSYSVPAISFTGFQVKVLTNGKFNNARIKTIDIEKINDAVSKGKVCVVAGFQGIDEHNNVVTLGRGGSDTSAVALAAALQSKECEIFTDVDGIYTADPNCVPGARKLNEISYDEMLELASLGAGVLHPRSVQFAKKYGVTVHVRSSFSNQQGTIVLSERQMMEQLLVTGISLKTDEARVSVTSIPDRPGIAAELFGNLANEDINVDMIAQSTGENRLNTISFTILKDHLNPAKKVIQNLISRWTKGQVSIDDKIAILSTVGVGMKSHAGVAARMFQTLAKHKINIEMISTSEIKISCVIAQEKADHALRLVHDSLVEFM